MLFSYHAIVSSFQEAERISISPSPSISVAKTDLALSAFIAISVAVQEEASPLLFSYHAMVSSSVEADNISISPSPSISAAKTLHAPSALVAISVAVQEEASPLLFSYQAMVSSIQEAERISISPSPSISAAKTDLAPSALVAISEAVKEV